MVKFLKKIYMYIIMLAGMFKDLCHKFTLLVLWREFWSGQHLMKLTGKSKVVHFINLEVNDLTFCASLQCQVHRVMNIYAIGKQNNTASQNIPTSITVLCCLATQLHCSYFNILRLSLIHIWRCRRIERCRSRWSPYH